MLKLCTKSGKFKMAIITIKDLHKAWKTYRSNHHKYRQFNFGFTGFPNFLGIKREILTIWLNDDTKHADNGTIHLDLTPAALARLKVLLEHPNSENTWIMLKI